jgi:lysophospholipase L1-like esterase
MARRAFLIAAILFISIVVFLEGIANWMLYHPQYIPSYLLESYFFYYDFLDRSIIQFENDKTAYHPELTYTLRPSSRFNFSNAEFNTAYSTNSLGLRDSENTLTAPAIICIGDSYTMGWGVNQSETFPFQLARLSGKSTLNAGISSYGTARELELLKKTDQSNLQYLIIQYCSNDIVENGVYIDSNYHLPVTAEKEFEEAQESYTVNRIYFPGKVFLVILQHFAKSAINRIYPLFSLPSERVPADDERLHAQRFAEILSHSAINFRKVKVVITRLNMYSFLGGNFLDEFRLLASRAPYYETFGKYITIVDCKTTLRESDYLILDVHLKPSGHRKVAEVLNRVLFNTKGP